MKQAFITFFGGMSLFCLGAVVLGGLPVFEGLGASVCCAIFAWIVEKAD